MEEKNFFHGLIKNHPCLGERIINPEKAKTVKDEEDCSQCSRSS
jgi:hypothetical protein